MFLRTPTLRSGGLKLSYLITAKAAVHNYANQFSSETAALKMFTNVL
jgi:hypothetical protein